MNSRRTFIQQVGVLSAGALILPSLGFAFASKNFGLQLYTLRGMIPKDVRGTIEKVAAAGYKEVEPYGYTLDKGFWGLSPKDFLKLLNDNGLKAVSGHYNTDQLLGDGGFDEIKGFIEAAKTIKSSYLTIPFIEGNLRKTADQYKIFAERFNKAGELCKSAGIQLAYHNHDFEFDKFGDTTGYDILLDGTDKSLVKFELDIYWVIRAGIDPLDLFAKNPGRFPLWHVKDMSKTNIKQNTEVGNGSIDYKKLMKMKDLAGMKHIFVEQENNYQPNEIDSIKASSSYIRSQLL